MILRNFLYLDTSMLNDYLSTIEGYLEEGLIDQTEIEKSNKSGKANAKFIEGNLESESSTETKQKLARTEASKFNKLYEYLSQNNSSQFLDAFDDDIWLQIKRGEILEIPAKISVSKVFKLTQDLQNISPIVEIMQALGQAPFKDDKEAKIFTGMSKIGNHAATQNVPLIFETESTKGYKFITHLQRQFIKTDIQNFEGSADIIGKVQRIVPKGKQEEVFSLIPAFDTLVGTMNRDQKRKMINDKKTNNLSDIIKGPAMIITPLAIYR